MITDIHPHAKPQLRMLKDSNVTRKIGWPPPQREMRIKPPINWLDIIGTVAVLAIFAWLVIR